MVKTLVDDFSVLAIKPGHDGAIAYVSNGELRFSFESEKDNGTRYAEIDSATFMKAMSACDGIPDVIALGGWSTGLDPAGEPIAAGYCGLAPGLEVPLKFLGRTVSSFTSSHERSHIMCAYGLSPFKQGDPCYVLVWEGHIGAFYFVNEEVTITKLSEALVDPGVRYAFLYALADPTFKMGRGAIRLSDAGKLMAITSYATGKHVCKDGAEVVDRILDAHIRGVNLCKEDFVLSKFYNCGVTNPDFIEVAKLLSDRLYEIFQSVARSVVRESYPLLISGGCGLNCEWNSRWIDSGIFSNVFIPPCANDSGSAIGTAIDAMFHKTGTAKVKWSVYSGELPVADIDSCPGFEEHPYDARAVAGVLKNDRVLGWMKGRYEMGPRALGARSILASPRLQETLLRLNQIKRREKFRPIAPVCMEDDMADYFSPGNASPYMLEFRKVIMGGIPATTHVDLSARPQSVSSDQNPDLYQLLMRFRDISGLAVLCNTSLNFNGGGFLNRLSDLYKFALQHELDGFIFENRFFLRGGGL
ncbi:carbamoyltransferase C-terminal domain-containing protein [Herbaspirillum rhizosphaerae]|uniref:carbamoyltransferase C-terminal domain-containing protein n=1 Tax=Herbaspirillum rhizosphaerae TaxID=346179 RepID=UPI00067D11B2|nr:carbamoyltransferase C-terminal domain-containing protein [Herbaspirillum rhizosphaerae]